MDAIARSSAETTFGSDEGLLSRIGSAQTSRQYHGKNSKRASWGIWLPWTLCVALLVAIVIQARMVRMCVLSPQAPFWGRTELNIAKREIIPATKQVRFTDGLRWNSTKQLYRELDPSVQDYTGKPTDEITAAWRDLISTTDIFLTENEVKEDIADQGTFSYSPHHDALYTDPYTGLYQAVPTVFHDLHCLDKIRRGVYVEYYPEDKNSIFWPHIEHCLDTIRQSIMCYADMTPIPEFYTDFNPLGKLQPYFQVEHTCRDFEAIKKWAKGRDALDSKVWKQNAERLKPGVWNG